MFSYKQFLKNFIQYLRSHSNLASKNVILSFSFCFYFFLFSFFLLLYFTAILLLIL